MKITSLFSTIARNAGLDVESNEEIKKLLENENLSNVEIDDATGNVITSKLLTPESAKNNPEIKKHYFAQAYNGLDSEIERVMDEIGVSDEVKEAINSETSSTKKAAMLSREIHKSGKKALEEIKSGKGTKKDQEELAEKVNALQQKLADAKKEAESKVSEVESNYQNRLTDMMIKNQLSQQSFANENLDPETNVMVAKNIIDQELKKNNLNLEPDFENLALHLKNEDSTDYFDDKQQKVTFGDFVNSVLADKKLIKVSDEAGNGNPEQPAQPVAPAQPNQGQRGVTSEWTEAANKQAQQADNLG